MAVALGEVVSACMCSTMPFYNMQEFFFRHSQFLSFLSERM